MTKCIFAENEQKCILKNLCTSSLSKEICNSSFTLNPNTTKCVYNDDINECEIKELCDIEENPSLNKCNEIPTTNSYEEKCIYDEKKENVLGKKFVLMLNLSPSIETCQESLTSDKKLKCIFDENNNKCVEKILCNSLEKNSEINCQKAETLNNNTKCIYNEQTMKCEEKEICLFITNIIDEYSCISAPTSDDLRRKCVLTIENNVKKCQEILKLCSEISNGATEEICSNSLTSKDNKKCVLNNNGISCIEVDKIEESKTNYEFKTEEEKEEEITKFEDNKEEEIDKIEENKEEVEKFEEYDEEILDKSEKNDKELESNNIEENSKEEQLFNYTDKNNDSFKIIHLFLSLFCLLFLF